MNRLAAILETYRRECPAIRAAMVAFFLAMLIYGAGTNAWPADWVPITDSVSTNVSDFAATGEALSFAEFRDIDRDGRYSPEGDQAIVRTVAPILRACRTWGFQQTVVPAARQSANTFNNIL
ncbi:MAG: hypothetical protein IKH04_05415 [Kiritimatiellae bacterium]|nr:hypothetical protein [Kiritimatiellia bacterium]